MSKVADFLLCRTVTNSFYVLNCLYIQIMLVMILISIGASLLGMEYVSNKLFRYAAYAFGVLLLNSTLMAVYATITKREELLK